MCFGSKEKRLVDDDDAPRPAHGEFPKQPIYANPSPKSSVPAFQQPQQQHQQQQQYQSHPPPVSPISPVSAVGAPSPYPYAAPNMAPPPPVAELPAVKQSNPPAELSSDYAPPPGPPPSHNQNNDFAPPPGPPPFHMNTTDYAPPPGPPPSHSQAGANSTSDYAPPPGPPPSKDQDLSYIAPPPGPPPSQDPKKHNWESAVPDTSLFPPPPAIFSGFYRSPSSNASEEDANAGEQWCAENPLLPPLDLDQHALLALQHNDIRLMAPTMGIYKGQLNWVAPGVWAGSTPPDARDSTIIGYPPLYSVKQHSPLLLPAGGKRTVYYEVAVKPSQFHPKQICLALGFTALPYPSFRMPGWHRGSLAVHGDDGHRYVNDRWGGKDFTEPFRVGARYGVGMHFTAALGGIETEVFFTRDGQVVGRWNLHEETDAQEDLPVTGLEGFHDLSCAVGTYEAVAFEVVFDPAKWAYRPQ